MVVTIRGNSRSSRPTKSVGCSTGQCLRDCLKAVFDLLYVLGLRRGDVRSFDRTLAHWERGASIVGSWVKFVKYKLAAYFASHTGQDLPQPCGNLDSIGDRPGSLLCGRAGRFLEGTLRRATRERKLGMLASLKLSKKGMPRPTPDMVDASVASTVAKLTGPCPQAMSWGRIDEIGEMLRNRGVSDTQMFSFGYTRMDVEQQLRRTVRELFDGEEYKWEDRVHLMFPSTSSNYINSRSAGGAVTYCVDLAKKLNLNRPEGYIRVRSAAVRQIGGGHPEELEMVGVIDGDSELRAAYSVLWINLLRTASTQRFVVKPVGLAEALKVRVITKGNAAAQTVMRSMQRKMFAVLARHKTFRSLVVGGDLPVEFVESQLGRLHGDQRFLSGDYEAATDNLHSWVSEAIMDEVCKCLRVSGVERDICMRLLTGHYFMKDGVLTAQTRGQLMGSIISFPVLCIANAALCRMVVEMDRGMLSRGGPRVQNLTLQQSQMLINGDDLLIKVSEFGRRMWSIIGREVMGLVESIGKTYWSSEFVEMNSRLFMYDDRHLPEYRYTEELARIGRDGMIENRTVEKFRFFHQTPLLNLGLLYGLVRSSAGGSSEISTVSTTRSYSIGARCRLLAVESDAGGGFGAAVWKRVRRLFIARNCTVLGTTKVPWYVPERLGGLGIPGLPSSRDLRCCRAALLNDLTFTSSVNGKWLVWRLASQRIEHELGAFKRLLTVEERLVADRAVHSLVIDSIFNDRLSSSLLLDERQAAKVASRRNERQWVKLLNGRYGYPSLAYYKRLLGFTMIPDRYAERENWKVPSVFLVPDDDEYFRKEMVRYLEVSELDVGVPFSVGDALYDD